MLNGLGGNHLLGWGACAKAPIERKKIAINSYQNKRSFIGINHIAGRL
jgi:hypothetical protein